jgi:hypothetical protein
VIADIRLLVNALTFALEVTIVPEFSAGVRSTLEKLRSMALSRKPWTLNIILTWPSMSKTRVQGM